MDDNWTARQDQTDPDRIAIKRPPLLKRLIDPESGEEVYVLTKAGKETAERLKQAETN